jgi:riboflavin synthase
MFTGIIEELGKITKLSRKGTNIDFTIESSISNELKIDQSLAHNGVCLTVIQKDAHSHVVTAIKETLDRSNIGDLREGSLVNLERAMTTNSRLDGHMVQGHVDATAKCISIKEESGSWVFTFSYDSTHSNLIVDKGSVCINGVSLTVVDPTHEYFRVAIIPYTYEHTTFSALQENDSVNIEFDIIGKYIAKHAAAYIK